LLYEIINKDQLIGMNFLMNLDAGGSEFYRFSEKDIDLAVISLNSPFHKLFAKTILDLGFEPISSEKIIDQPTSEGSDIYSIGFPSVTSVLLDRRKLIDRRILNSNWESWFASEPTFSFGKVAMLNRILNYFLCDMSVYPGNSGSPVIQDDKLVGIVSAQPLLENQRVLFAIVIKAEFIRSLLDNLYKRDMENWVK